MHYSLWYNCGQFSLCNRPFVALAKNIDLRNIAGAWDRDAYQGLRVWGAGTMDCFTRRLNLGVAGAALILGVFVLGPPASATPTTTTTTYSYDPLGRVEEAADPADTADYSYDDSGNRVQNVGTNVCPKARDDSFNAFAGTPKVLTVLANDTDADNDPIIVTYVSTPGHGTAVIDPGGTSITYTANPSFAGTEDPITYKISDGQCQKQAIITISVPYF